MNNKILFFRISEISNEKKIFLTIATKIKLHEYKKIFQYVFLKIRVTWERAFICYNRSTYFFHYLWWNLQIQKFIQPSTISWNYMQLSIVLSWPWIIMENVFTNHYLCFPLQKITSAQKPSHWKLFIFFLSPLLIRFNVNMHTTVLMMRNENLHVFPNWYYVRQYSCMDWENIISKI